MGRVLTVALLLMLASLVTGQRNSDPMHRGRRKKSHGNHFERHDKVEVIANKIGPYNNPTETYSYHKLPFCHPGDLGKQSHELGELLVGDRKVNTPYEINFDVNVEWRELCTQTLGADDIAAFYDAIDRDYYFELFLDGLPIWGYIGEYETENLFLEHTSIARHYLYTHLHYAVGHNDGQVVAVNVSLGLPPDFFPERVEMTGQKKLDVVFSYSVSWHVSDLPYEQRMDRYKQDEFLPTTIEVHWLSIINSFVLVVLLTVFLSIILLRVLKNDFTRYMGSADDADFMDDETGWKLIHGDVFRFPTHKMLLASCVGVGLQLMFVAMSVILLALFEVFDPTKRGSVLTAGIITYALTAGVGGYVAGRLYKQLGGTNWVWNIMLTATLLPGPLTVVFSFLNTTAIAHGSTAALPFGTIMVLVALYVLVTFPLTVIGGIAGRNTGQLMETPCRTKMVARELPVLPWYRHPVAQTLLSGFLPFSAIYIELHYIFASIWGHKVYTLFGILALAFAMLIIVTAFVTIAFTYFQLIVEDYRWWWRSFFSGGSTGIIVFVYCFYYFFRRSEMHGFLQTSYYFGYMACMAYAFVLGLGSLGFFSALYFVHYIYSSIKCD